MQLFRNTTLGEHVHHRCLARLQQLHRISNLRRILLNIKRLVGQNKRRNILGSLRSSSLTYSTTRGETQRLLHDVPTQPARPRNRQRQPCFDPDVFQSFTSGQNRLAFTDPCRGSRQLSSLRRRRSQTGRLIQRLNNIVNLAHALQRPRNSPPTPCEVHKGIGSNIQRETQRHLCFASRLNTQLVGDACFTQHLRHEHVIVGLLPPIHGGNATLAAREEPLKRVLPLKELGVVVDNFLDA